MIPKNNVILHVLINKDTTLGNGMYCIAYEISHQEKGQLSTRTLHSMCALILKADITNYGHPCLLYQTK